MARTVSTREFEPTWIYQPKPTRLINPTRTTIRTTTIVVNSWYCQNLFFRNNKRPKSLIELLRILSMDFYVSFGRRKSQSTQMLFQFEGKFVASSLTWRNVEEFFNRLWYGLWILAIRQTSWQEFGFEVTYFYYLLVLYWNGITKLSISI